MADNSMRRVAILGAGMIGEVHRRAALLAGAEVVGVMASTPERSREVAEKWRVDQAYASIEDVVASDVDVVHICTPNSSHVPFAVELMEAGKHVICEKPLCVTLAEADRMVAACRQTGVKLMYAEELCFTPKYVRAKQLVDEGALGEVYLVKQSEKHSGPHADWFWDVRRSGGGVTFDMGCHAVEFFRWVLGKPAIRSVYAQLGTHAHAGRTEGDDNAVLVLEFDGGAIGLAEESWAKPGGMDDRAEIHGTRGVTYADLLHGSALETYSEVGYGYAVEKADGTRGWTFTMFEELWNYGFPQELEHFVACVQHDQPALETGEDGRAVLEAIYAAYESARTGAKVTLPFTPPPWATAPIHCWKPWLAPEAPADLAR